MCGQGEGHCPSGPGMIPQSTRQKQPCFSKFVNTMLYLRKRILSIYNCIIMSIGQLSIFLCKPIYMFSYNYLIVTLIIDVLRQWGTNELSGL